MTSTRVRLRLRAELHLIGVAVWRGLVRLLNSSDLTHAAAIAYYALLSLFPFVLLMLSVLGWAAAEESDRIAVENFVFRYLPARVDLVSTQLEGLRRMSPQVGVAGGLGLIWASLGVFNAITGAVNEAWGVAQRRSFWKHRIASFIMFAAASGAILASLLIVSTLGMAGIGWVGALLSRIPWMGGVQALLIHYAASLVLVTALALVFYFVPNAPVRFRDVWVGAVFTGVLWTGAFNGFSAYLGINRQFALLQGSVTGAVACLIWVYLSSIILIYGVEFTAAYARLRRGRSEDLPASGPVDDAAAEKVMGG